MSLAYTMDIPRGFGTESEPRPDYDEETKLMRTVWPVEQGYGD